MSYTHSQAWNNACAPNGPPNAVNIETPLALIFGSLGPCGHRHSPPAATRSFCTSSESVWVLQCGNTRSWDKAHTPNAFPNVAKTTVTDRIHTGIKNDQRTFTGKEKSIQQPNVTALQWHVFSAKTIATDRTRRTNGEQDQKVILSY